VGGKKYQITKTGGKNEKGRENKGVYPRKSEFFFSERRRFRGNTKTVVTGGGYAFLKLFVDPCERGGKKEARRKKKKRGKKKRGTKTKNRHLPGSLREGNLKDDSGLRKKKKTEPNSPKKNWMGGGVGCTAAQNKGRNTKSNLHCEGKKNGVQKGGVIKKTGGQRKERNECKNRKQPHEGEDFIWRDRNKGQQV